MATGLAVLGIVCGVVALFGDNVRISFARMLVPFLNANANANIPDSSVFDPAKEQETAALIQSAMDSKDSSGRRGGWEAANRIIAEQRKQGEIFLTLPEPLAITILLGMPGKFAPLTSFEAQQRLSAIKRQYHEAGAPDFIFQRALAEAVKKLKESDDQPGYLGRGCLAKIFEMRQHDSAGLAIRAREQAVLLYLQQQPEYRKFLGRDADDNYLLPDGESYESFATNMLINAYGPIPQ